jgi:hypothetical protein
MRTMMSPTTFDARFRPLLKVQPLRPPRHWPGNGTFNEGFSMPASLPELDVAHPRVTCPRPSAE